MRMDYKIRKLVLINGLINFTGGLITPITAAYLTLLEYTLSEISLYMIASRIISLVFETPSGFYSDKYGRLPVGRLSLVFSTIFTVCLLLVSNKEIIYLVAVFGGLFNSLNSGTFDVLLFNELEKNREMARFGHVSSTLSLYSASGLFVGILVAIPILLGFYDSLYGFKALLFLASIIPICILFLSAKIDEKPSIDNTKNHMQTNKIKLQSVLSLSFAVVMTFLIFFYSGYHSIERFFQVFLVKNTSSEYQLITLTSVYFFSTICSAHGSKISDRLAQKSNESRRIISILSSLIASIFLYLSVTFSNDFYVVFVKLISVWFFALSFTFFRKEILQSVSDLHRSAVTSIINTIQSVSIFIGLGLVGISTTIQPEVNYLSFSLLLLTISSVGLSLAICGKSYKSRTA